MDKATVTVIELSGNDFTPRVHSIELEQSRQQTTESQKLISHMLQAQGGIFLVEISFGEEAQVESEYDWYSVFATAQGHKGKLRVIEDDQLLRHYRFFVYRMPAEHDGNTLISCL